MGDFTYSEYSEPLTPPNKNTGEFKAKMNGLPVGKAFVVTGMKQSNLVSRVNGYAMRYGGKFRVNKIDEDRIQVYREE